MGSPTLLDVRDLEERSQESTPELPAVEGWRQAELTATPPRSQCTRCGGVFNVQPWARGRPDILCRDWHRAGSGRCQSCERQRWAEKGGIGNTWIARLEHLPPLDKQLSERLRYICGEHPCAECGERIAADWKFCARCTEGFALPSFGETKKVLIRRDGETGGGDSDTRNRLGGIAKEDLKGLSVGDPAPISTALGAPPEGIHDREFALKSVAGISTNVRLRITADDTLITPRREWQRAQNRIIAQVSETVSAKTVGEIFGKGERRIQQIRKISPNSQEGGETMACPGGCLCDQCCKAARSVAYSYWKLA